MTDVDKGRIDRAKQLISPERAASFGVEMVFVDASGGAGTAESLMAITGGRGYDDVFVYAPVKALAELCDKCLAPDGCLNFFAGPTDAGFSANINLYNCHYSGAHILGSTGATQTT